MSCGQQQQPLPPPRKIANVGPCNSSRRRTSPSSPSSARNVWSCLIVVTGLLDWPSLLLLRPRCRGHLPSPGLPRRRLGKESACQSANAEDLGDCETAHGLPQRRSQTISWRKYKSSLIASIRAQLISALRSSLVKIYSQRASQSRN